jgi:hypothetical protein
MEDFSSMKYFLTLLTAFCLWCSVAAAAVEEVRVGGTVDIDSIWSNNIMDLDSSLKDQPAFSEGEIHVTVEPRLTDHVSAFLDLESEGNTHYLDSNNVDAGLRQAYMKAEGFIFDTLNFKIGKMDFEQNLRLNQSLKRYSSWLIRLEGAPGIYTELEFFEQMFVSGWWFKIDENSFNNQRNPGVQTGDTLDKDLVGLSGDLYWSQFNLLRAYTFMVQDNSLRNLHPELGDGKRYYTSGLGSDFMYHDFEIYGEFAYQWGRFSRMPAYDVNVNAFGGYLGTEYTWIHRWSKPFLGGEILYQGGDSWDKQTKKMRSAGWQRDFADSRKSLIFESTGGHEGRGWYEFMDDPFLLPYTASSKRNDDDAIAYLRCVAGLKKIDLPHSSLRVEQLWTYFIDTDQSDVDSFGGDIGNEIDWIATWSYSEDLTFACGFGLFFPDEDFAANRWGPNADSDPVWKVIFQTTISF